MIDLKDTLIVTGTLTIMVGTYIINPIYAIISTGICLFLIGLRAM